MITRKEETLSPLTRKALAKRVAERAGTDTKTTTSVIKALFEVVQEALLEGEQVDLNGVLDLGVVVEPARIRRESSGRFSEIAPARRRLHVEVSEPLREQLAQQRTAAILLAMRKQGQFSDILANHFARLGWKVQMVDSLPACQALLEGSQPYLVVADHALKGRDDFVAQLKSTWRTNPIPVITLHTRHENLRKAAELRIEGDLAAVEPIEVNPFLVAADQVLAQATEEAAVFERQIRFRLPAREEEILRAFDLADGFFKDAGFRGDSLVGLTTAFREAMRNAELHGCSASPELGIGVELLLDGEKLTATVEDDGKGFEHGKYRDGIGGSAPVSIARKRHRSGESGGLGIYLMERCADGLEYNDRGNRVTLTKLRGTEPEPDPQDQEG